MIAHLRKRSVSSIEKKHWYKTTWSRMLELSFRASRKHVLPMKMKGAVNDFFQCPQENIDCQSPHKNIKQSQRTVFWGGTAGE